MERIHIGELIKEVMSEKRFTQTELAESISMTKQGFHSILKKNTLNTDLLDRINSAMNVNLYYLIAEKMGYKKSNMVSEPLEKYQANEEKISIIISVDGIKANQIMKIIGL